MSSILDAVNLPHTATIERQDFTQDATYGGVVDAYVELATSKKCWVQNVSSSELNDFMKRDQKVSHKVFFVGGWPHANLDGNVNHAIQITAGPSFVGSRFLVLHGTDRSAGLGLLQAVFVFELTNDSRDV